MASTGLFQNNTDSTTTGKENMFVQGAKKLAGFVADLVKTVPVVGTVMSVMDGIIDAIYDEVKTKRFEDRTNIINKIIGGDSNIDRLSLHKYHQCKKRDNYQSSKEG